mgnify:FL=1
MKTDRIIFALYLLANLIYITIEKNKIISKREMIGDQSAIYQKELAIELKKECERSIFCYL